MCLPWSLLVVSVIGMTAILRWYGILDPYWLKTSPAILWKHIWPIVAAMGLVALHLFAKPLFVWPRWLHIPAGDLVVPVAALSIWLIRIWNRRLVNPLTHCSSFVSSWRSATSATTLPFSRLSAVVENWAAVGFFVTLLAAVLFILLILGFNDSQ